MRRRVLSRIRVALCAAGLLFGGAGCGNSALGLQDWQRDLLSVGMSAVLNALLATPARTVTIVERQCFEDQGGALVEIDCANLPGGP